MREDQLLERAADLIARKHMESELLTPAQVGGMLNVSPSALWKLKIPRVDLFGSEKTVRYTRAAVADYLAAKTIH